MRGDHGRKPDHPRPRMVPLLRRASIPQRPPFGTLRAGAARNTNRMVFEGFPLGGPVRASRPRHAVGRCGPTRSTTGWPGSSIPATAAERRETPTVSGAVCQSRHDRPARRSRPPRHGWVRALQEPARDRRGTGGPARSAAGNGPTTAAVGPSRRRCRSPTGVLAVMLAAAIGGAPARRQGWSR